MGSAMGGAYSLAIFLPQVNTLLSLSARLLFFALVALTVFGFENARKFLKAYLVLSAVNFLFAGAVLGLWLLFKPEALIIKNGAFYLDISFLTLVLSAAGLYAAVWLFSRVFGKKSDEAKCRVELIFCEKQLSLNGIVDTGNTLFDSFTGKPISVLSLSAAVGLLPADACAAALSGEYERLPAGMHLTVLNTVSGEGLLPVFTAQMLKIKINGEIIAVENAAVAVSREEQFAENISILVNSELIGGERNAQKNNRKNQSAVQKEKRRNILHKRPANSAASAERTKGARGNARS